MKRCAASFRGSRARDLTLFFSLPLSALYEIFFTLTKLRNVFFIIIVQQVFFLLVRLVLLVLFQFLTNVLYCFFFTYIYHTIRFFFSFSIFLSSFPKGLLMKENASITPKSILDYYSSPPFPLQWTYFA